MCVHRCATKLVRVMIRVPLGSNTARNHVVYLQQAVLRPTYPRRTGKRVDSNAQRANFGWRWVGSESANLAFYLGGPCVFRTLTVLLAVFSAAPLLAAQKETEPPPSGPPLRINSRAVLVDVIVTDAHGNPVPGLPRDAFSVTEQGK